MAHEIILNNNKRLRQNETAALKGKDMAAQNLVTSVSIRHPRNPVVPCKKMKGVAKYQIFLGSDTERCKLLLRKDVDNFLTYSLKILIPSVSSI